ncbi:NAD(P)H-hydrate dehydratase [Ruegeria sp. SCPT10]|uniref:NAD(P)H-hydrate dehydratase n=1 Tax=Ruegeria sp. SCP10 TaxID=3141377 RepID=UPI003338A49E
MVELLTAAQMRAIEQAAIESGKVTGLELMERAGQGVVEAIFEEWPELTDRGASPSSSPGYLGPDEEDPLRAVVLCGPGNNGGDGFVVARLLRERGWEVEVFLYGDPLKLPPDARMNYERWISIGEANPPSKLPTDTCLKLIDVFSKAEVPTVFVDAVFGTGLSKPLSKSTFEFDLLMQNLISHENVKRVAVDVPSGLCSDSGKQIGHSYRAELTVSFNALKDGHVLGMGPDVCGKVVVKSIGLERKGLSERASDPVQLIEIDLDSDCDVFSETRELTKSASSHKYSHGHALILSGGPGKTGAARLAARAPLRIGAGLATLGVPPSAQMEVAAQVTAIMLQRVEGADGLSEVLQDERLNALCLGPGLGLDRARELVPVALEAGRATVLDADALTAFADDPVALFAQLHKNCVLTPHGGEFARLFPDISEKLNAVPIKGPAYSKVDATREAAQRAGCIVLFKGPDTVIANPDGQCSINAAVYERGAPWLATAGSGDVLAGFITGLLARGFGPMQAAESAAWLHVECARQFGPGLVAEDLPEQLPAVFRTLET